MTLKWTSLLATLFFLAAPHSQADTASVQLASFSATPGFQVSDIKNVASDKSGSARFPLTIIVDSNSRWDESQVRMDIASTVAIYNKCGVSVSPITIVKATHPQFGNVDCATDFGVTQDIPAAVPRPVVIYTSRLFCSTIGP